ncbi:hypothetical protein BCU70_02215 [Vibrio sp. 10N.286.49.C2]|uniref:hypothetical protein n=1 Tax=unclassified Vibrio TaxID=2614977 RepID=UPI000C83C20D|nr:MULTISPECIES: hypothetical protein [unclassified Vibrio]PMH38118.1 hypothetical protein BCU70_02215 [Vibrio sp. 10N.286.49.C2]PMH53676.1 hypothetical protein BCU66_12620 [Vibrio sp. 10N.286.49.B1]PMH82605.1 hypothetical protein BCU58_17675 [Vibrio sp. 10N.286.48.B7]
MKIKLLSLVMGSVMLTGCMSTQVGVWDDREELLTNIDSQCQEHTQDFTKYSPSFDTASMAILTVAQRQCEVTGKYQEIRKNHKDVEQFFAIHADKSKEEIIVLLDQDPKLKKKYDDYTKAQGDIFSANLDLAVNLGVQSVTVAQVYAENAVPIAQAEAIKMVTGAIDPEEHPIGFVYDEMKTRVSLISESNGLISAEQAFIKEMEEADKAIQARVERNNDAS